MCFISGLSLITAASAICESAPSIFHSNKEPCISCKYYVWLFHYVWLLALLPRRHSYFFSRSRCADASFVIFSETHFGIYYFFSPLHQPISGQHLANGGGPREAREAHGRRTLPQHCLSLHCPSGQLLRPEWPQPHLRARQDAGWVTWRLQEKLFWFLRYFAVMKSVKKNIQSF